MQTPPVLKVRLVHAEPGQRVVQVSAWQGTSCLGSALGEAAGAEDAEERAIARLQQRLAAAAPAGTPETAAAPAANGAVRHPVIRPASIPAPPPVDENEGPEALDPPQPSLFGTSESGPTAESLPPAAASVEPPADPDDWSDELAELEVQLQRIGWDRSQEGQYLQRAFGHPSRNRLTAYTDLVSYLRCLRNLGTGSDPNSAPVPLRRKDLLEQSDQLLRSLQWDATRGRQLLEQQFQRSSRQQLSDEQLLHFNMLLEEALIRTDEIGQPDRVLTSSH